MTSTLFSSIKLADLELSNRIVVAPMCQYSADDGSANDWHIQHDGMLANSGASLVVVEATHVERHGRITHGCTGLYSDHNESAMARVVAHCKRAGTAKMGIQLAHAGRKASSQRPWEGGGPLKEGQDPWQTIAPSAIPFGPNWHTPRAMTEDDIARVPPGVRCAPASTCLNCITRTVTWRTPSCRRSPITAPTGMAARLKTACASASRRRARCAPWCRSTFRSACGSPRSNGRRVASRTARSSPSARR
jgi:hypothetical protein